MELLPRSCSKAYVTRETKIRKSQWGIVVGLEEGAGTITRVSVSIK